DRIAQRPSMGPFALENAGRLSRDIALGQWLPSCSPGLGPTFDADHVLKSLLSQKLGRAQRAESTLADHVYGAVGRHLSQPTSQIGLGKVDGCRHVAVRE